MIQFFPLERSKYFYIWGEKAEHLIAWLWFLTYTVTRGSWYQILVLGYSLTSIPSFNLVSVRVSNNSIDVSASFIRDIFFFQFKPTWTIRILTLSNLGRVGRSRCYPPQELTARDDLHSFCVWQRDFLWLRTTTLDMRSTWRRISSVLSFNMSIGTSLL